MWLNFNLNFTISELEYKKLFCIGFWDWEQTIYGWIALTLKNLLEQNFHGLVFISKLSFICSGIFINVTVVAVFNSVSS